MTKSRLWLMMILWLAGCSTVPVNQQPGQQVFQVDQLLPDQVKFVEGYSPELFRYWKNDLRLSDEEIKVKLYSRANFVREQASEAFISVGQCVTGKTS